MRPVHEGTCHVGLQTRRVGEYGGRRRRADVAAALRVRPCGGHFVEDLVQDGPAFGEGTERDVGGLREGEARRRGELANDGREL